MALFTYLVDFAATAFGAKRFGAPKQAVIGAGIGATIGLALAVAGKLALGFSPVGVFAIVRFF